MLDLVGILCNILGGKLKCGDMVVIVLGKPCFKSPEKTKKSIDPPHRRSGTLMVFDEGAI